MKLARNDDKQVPLGAGGVQAAKLRLGFLHELGTGVSQNFEVGVVILFLPSWVFILY